MLIKDTSEISSFTAGDNTIIKELLSPLKDNVSTGYSVALAELGPGRESYRHSIEASEVYYIIQGAGEMHINEEAENVKSGQLIYIPSKAEQYIKNTGKEKLVFLCIVDPPWRKELESVVRS